MNKTTLIISEGTREIYDICAIVEEIVIPEGVTSIGDYAFYCYLSLTEITIPDSVTSIGRQAFWYCSSLTKINIPNSVTSIGAWAFEGCTSLKAIYIDKEKGTLDLSDTKIPEDCKVYWKGEFKEEDDE